MSERDIVAEARKLTAKFDGPLDWLFPGFYDSARELLIALADEIERVRGALKSAMERTAELRAAASRENEEICQTLGKALGYPWFKDDPANFPNATEEDGVCVGEHVAGSLATEAAERIRNLTAERDRYRKFAPIASIRGDRERDGE